MLIAGAGILTVSALFVGVWAWSGSARKQYATDVQGYEQRIQKAYDALGEQPEDTDAYQQYLADHSKALRHVTTEAPQEPGLLWFSAAASQDVARNKELTAATDSLRAAMDEYRSFIVFRNSLLEAMRDSSGLIGTIDEIKTAKANFEATQRKLELLNPPKGLETFTEPRIQAYKTLVTSANDLIAAHNKGDIDAFRAALTPFTEATAEVSVSATATELADNRTYYNTFVSAATKLEDKLK